MNPLRLVSKGLFDDRLNTDGPSHTFMRICTSRHVDDLQGVVTVALLAVAGLMLIILDQSARNTAALKDQIGIYTVVLAAVAGTISWSYQSGSRRLGAVDLFASEISAICRVCLVVDFAVRSVERAEEAATQVRAHATALITHTAAEDKGSAGTKGSVVQDAATTKSKARTS